MGRRNARNSSVLKGAKDRTSPKVYDLLLKLINSDREDLAELVLKIDYLFEYASVCIKQKDYKEAKESLSKAKKRMDKVKEEDLGINIECLDYLYEGIQKKIK